METVFFVWSNLRLYNEDSWSNESAVRQSRANKDVNMETEESALLERVT
jgi:hypothetical protein